MTNYKRIIIKVSGESLCGGKFGIDGGSVKKLALQLKKIAELGVQTSVVVCSELRANLSFRRLSHHHP